MTTATAAPPDVRSSLAVALDLDDSVAALRLARELQPWFGVAKVGLELYSASGPDVVGALMDMGYQVFCDLKFHDIPTTVGRAARVIGALGATYLNFHAQGGAAMLSAGVDGFLAGASSAGLPAPIPLAVTVLTSDDQAPAHILQKRVQAALEGGCKGIVCAAADVHEAKQYGPRLTAVVPGIRPAGSPAHDQARAATPEEAMAAGADVLVIGRAVTRADDPAAAAAAVAESLTR
jgi:orotidine-5'-phosphate decarboxylase